MASDIAGGLPSPANGASGGGASGRLVLMPNALDLGSGHVVDLRTQLPDQAIARAAGLRHWVVENAKSARAFLKRVDAVHPLVAPLQEMQIVELPRAAHKGRAAPGGGASPWRALLAPALAGHDLGLLSEAGLPAVADPGSALVADAHAAGVPVEPWSGPSSLMLALAASGLEGQHFVFLGYLPVEAAARAARIRETETQSRRAQQTQIAIETPYRNEALMQALVAQLQPATRLSVSCGLGLPGGWSLTRAVTGWRREPAAFTPGLPAVFSWLAGT